MTYASEVLADSPLVYWRLGEANGAATAADASANNHPGTYGYSSGALTLGQTGLLTGDTDTAALFNGYNLAVGQNYIASVNAAYASWMNVPALSLECWVKTTQGGNVPLWDRDNGSSRAFQMRLNAGKLELVRITNAAGSIAVVTATSTIAVNDGNVHHLVVTYNGTTINLYIDGNLNASVAASGGLLAATSPLYFGYSAGGGVYAIGLTADELAYYGTVLSPARISAHYNAGTAAPIPTGTLAATTPRAAASLAGAYTAPSAPTGNLAAVVLRATASLAGSYLSTATGSLAATAPRVAAALSGSYSGATGTDTANLLNGRDRQASGYVTVTVPVVAVPGHLVVGERKDKARPLPTPTMVNGRPT